MGRTSRELEGVVVGSRSSREQGLGSRSDLEGTDSLIALGYSAQIEEEQSWKRYQHWDPTFEELLEDASSAATEDAREEVAKHIGHY